MLVKLYSLNVNVNGDLMITGSQIRAARGALHWTSEDLAKKSGITSRTIKRLEQSNGVPPSRTSVLEAIQKAFEDEGIEFVGRSDHGPGVRLWPERRLPFSSGER